MEVGDEVEDEEGQEGGHGDAGQEAGEPDPPEVRVLAGVDEEAADQAAQVQGRDVVLVALRILVEQDEREGGGQGQQHGDGHHEGGGADEPARDGRAGAHGERAHHAHEAHDPGAHLVGNALDGDDGVGVEARLGRGDAHDVGGADDEVVRHGADDGHAGEADEVAAEDPGTTAPEAAGRAVRQGPDQRDRDEHEDARHGGDPRVDGGGGGLVHRGEPQLKGRAQGEHHDVPAHGRQEDQRDGAGGPAVDAGDGLGVVLGLYGGGALAVGGPGVRGLVDEDPEGRVAVPGRGIGGIAHRSSLR